MTNEPLKHLGKYELASVLGVGAMGVVYRAFDPVLNRYLAIKVMNASIASDAALRERFLREARAAGSLQHPNVLTIYDFGEADDHLFIAMEFVEGSDLSEMMERAEPVSLALRLEIIIDSLHGLAYAHAHGLVHRDIKPANIRITPENRAKIMDFGIAHLPSSELTQSGVMIGTPQYMAPEQVVGGAITPATDIFAVGTVLYELLTGTKPFSGETPHAVLFNVVSKNPRPLRELVPSLPPKLDPILAKALAKEPAARYQTALGMAKDLAAVRMALMDRSGAEDAAAAARTAEYRSHSATAVRDPQLRSFIKRESAEQPVRARPRARTPWIVAAGASVAALVVIWMVTRTSGGSASVHSDGPTLTSGPATAAQSANVNVNAGTTAPAGGAAPASNGERPSPSRTARGAPPSNAAGSESVPRSTRTAELPVARGASDASAASAIGAPRDSLAASTVRQLAPPPARVAASPPPIPPAESVSRAAPDPRPDVERVIVAYARAIQSGNVAEIRRAYPGLTNSQQQDWDGFFRSVRNFRATLVMDQLAVTGSSATAGVSALYEYDNRTTGRPDRQQLRLQATLNREPGGWRLVSVQ